MSSMTSGFGFGVGNSLAHNTMNRIFNWGSGSSSNSQSVSSTPVSNQNQFGGGRYGIGEEVEQATQKSLTKASNKKATPVEINPVVQNTVAQTYN